MQIHISSVVKLISSQQQHQSNAAPFNSPVQSF